METDIDVDAGFAIAVLPAVRYTQWMASDRHEFFQFVKDWGQVREWLGKWLREHVSLARRVIDGPDLWARATTAGIQSEVPTVLNPNAEQEVFSSDKINQIRSALLDFREQVEKEFSPSAAQSRAIAERLEYLSRALDRLNPNDWRAVAVSTVMSIAVNLSVDTEGGRQLWVMFKEALALVNHLLG